jgi:hypothetical protein
MGVFPPDWLETTFMPAAVRKVTSTRALQSFSLQYGEPQATAVCARPAVAETGGHNVPAPPARSSPPWAPPMRWTS